MVIDLIKFLHIIVTLALLGTTGYCLLIVVATKFAFSLGEKDLLRSLNKSLLYLSSLAVLTGSLLVYPKGFTFQTPWIQAAYTLVSIFVLAVGCLFFFNRRRHRLLWTFFYGSFVVMLIIVIHDAVNKTTFLF